MKKGHMIALALGLVVLLIAAFMYLSDPVGEQADDIQQEESNVVLDLSIPEGELNVADPEDDEADELDSEITRIVIDQNEKDENVRDILSEKILIDDEVVDKPQPEQGSQ
ncbi:hypothetical protein [Endozoicomonas sp. OPT23]|uniref:hypothetical protein n=1 Tax=Endozoicomonas sp. OPT23 TaxID=2072845 RepID=UPI00129AB940|nr:hypothetical protein [Endozoicomonas sp. OPT23]